MLRDYGLEAKGLKNLQESLHNYERHPTVRIVPLRYRPLKGGTVNLHLLINDNGSSLMFKNANGMLTQIEKNTIYTVKDFIKN